MSRSAALAPPRTDPVRAGAEAASLYSAGIEELLAHVVAACSRSRSHSHSHSHSSSGSRDERPIDAGVAALLGWLSARPRTARLVLLDGPAAGPDVLSARADAHARFASLILGAVPGASVHTAKAGVRTMENLLAAHLHAGGASALDAAAPLLVQLLDATSPRRPSR